MLAGTVGIYGSTYAVEGSQNQGGFYITRSADSYPEITLELSYSGTALPIDYMPPLRTITMGAGVPMTQFYIQPIDDLLMEGSETVMVTMSSSNLPAGYTINPSTASIQLLDNDPPPVINWSVGGNTMAEPPTPALEGEFLSTFTITLSQPAPQNMNFTVNLVGGTAGQNQDYVAPSTSLPPPFTPAI